MVIHSENAADPETLSPLMVDELNIVSQIDPLAWMNNNQTCLYTQEPTGDNTRTRGYLLIGSGEKACIFCISKSTYNTRLDILNYDKPPSKAKIAEHHDWLMKANWYEKEKDPSLRGRTGKQFLYSHGSCSVSTFA